MKKLLKTVTLAVFILTQSCYNETVENVEIEEQEAIKVDSQLYGFLERVSKNTSEVSDDANIACVNFVYAFSVYVYDEELTFTGVQTISNDAEFSAFLGSLTPELYISLSYPITGTLLDGTEVSINNNEELKESIDTCLEEEITTYCNGVLTEDETCSWKVLYNGNGNNTYMNAFFNIGDDGLTTFFHDNSLFNGTWTSLYIDYQLYINIAFLDIDGIGQDWNHNWEATIINEERIILRRAIENEAGETSIVSYTIVKDCIVQDCSNLTYQACEIDGSTGIAEFIFNDYVGCTVSGLELSLEDGLTFSFFLNQVDAEANINPLDALTPYLNTANPQLVIVRIDNSSTLETTYYSIELTAINCEND